MPDSDKNNQAVVCPQDETGREALGRFLRNRREQIQPEDVGIASARGRRTPGLRREEVAFLADIGVKWYARLEAGDRIHPSPATLTGIAVALRLSDAELEYMLELAGVRYPAVPVAGINLTISETLTALLQNLRGIAATISDRILTPLRWNAMAEAIYGHSRYRLPVDRNGLVRALLDGELIALLGDERENFIFRAVGMFRLNQSSDRPSPLQNAVYEKVKREPLFLKAWNHRVVCHDLTEKGPAIRNHALVGKLAIFVTDLSVWAHPDLLVRTVSPADAENAAKFDRLARLAGSAVSVESRLYA